MTNTPLFLILASNAAKELLFDWAEGHPNNSLDCVALFNNSLITVSCAEVYPAICQRFIYKIFI